MRPIKLNNEKIKKSGFACQTEIAKTLGVSPSTVATWRKRDDFPVPAIVSVSATVALWDLSEVRAWRLSRVTHGRPVEDIISELEGKIKALKRLANGK